MAQSFYVDLTISTTGHAGSTTDPFSWLDVLTEITAATAGPSSTANIIFYLRGVGALFTTQNAFSWSNLSFATGSQIVFTSDNPYVYGLAVLGNPSAYGGGATAQAANSAFLQFTSPTNLTLRFKNLIIAANTSATSTNWTFLNVTNATSSFVSFENCPILDQGYPTAIMNVTSDAATQTAVVNNTVMYTTTASGQHVSFATTGGQAYTGRNYAVQATGSGSIITWAKHTTTYSTVHYTAGNVYSLLPSSVVYSGTTPQQIEADNVGVSYLTQGVWNPYQIAPANENPLSYASPGVSPSRTSVFWPVHGSAMLGIGTSTRAQINSFVDPTNIRKLGVVDALGIDRTDGNTDAGAFQKSGVSLPQVVNVNLSISGLTNNFGTETNPITITDFVLEYGRRAPVDCPLNYVLQGDNSGSPLTIFDMGPLAPNGITHFGGAGSITLSGWRTYKKAPPVFSLQKIRPNASLPIIISAIKLEYAPGSSTIFFETSVASTSKFRVESSVVRSRSTTNGRLAWTGASQAHLEFFGVSVHFLHSTGFSDGLVQSAGPEIDIELCAINMAGSTVLGSGNVGYVRATYVNTGALGNATWSGATIDSYSELNGTNPFIDPANVSYSAANFQLQISSGPIGIAPSSAALSVDGASSLAVDLRQLTRSSYPTGTLALDAGAYAYNYFVPEPSHYYLDIGKTRAGSGSAGDRWSPNDFQNWLNSLSYLNNQTVVHASRMGSMELTTRDVDANVNGSLTICSEQTTYPAVWLSGTHNLISGAAEFAFEISGVILGTTNGADAINLPASNVTLVNSILDLKRSQKSFQINVASGSSSSGDAITVVGATTATFTPGTNWTVVSGNTAATAVNIAASLVAGGFDAISIVNNGIVQVVGVTSVTLGGSPAILSVAQQAKAVQASNLVVAGCSVVENFNAELGVVSSIFNATTIDASHTAVQGTAFSSTSKSGTGFNATSGVTWYCGFNGLVTPHTGTTDTGSSTLGHVLFAVLNSADYQLSDYALNGTDLQNFVNAATLPSWEPSNSNVDIVGNERSQVYMNPTENTYDVGAIEVNYLLSTGTFNNTPSEPFLEVTEFGAELDARSAMGDVVFSLAGFAVGAGGSVYWDPTQVVPAVNDGTPLLSVVSIVGSSWAGDTLTVLAPTGSISVVAGSDFSASGATPVILNSIASALRNKKVVSSQLIAGTWTLGAGWSGNFSGGFTFAPGVVTTLTNTTTYAPGTYTISWTVSGRTAGSFNLSVGGFTLYAIASSGTANIRFSANTPITITPTTDFNGTIIPSIISYYTFNQGAWCRVINNTLEIRSWAYGTVANNYVSTSQYAVSKTGSNLAVTAFTGATDAVVTTGRSWPVTGYAPWFSTEIPDPRSVSFVARLDYGDGVGAIGEIVAMALISQSPLAAEVGRFYPYARVRLPLHVKHDREILVRRLMFAS